MVKLEYFGENFSLAVCGVSELRIDHGFKADEKNVAIRLYKNILDIDFSLIALFNSEQHPFWGINFAGILGDRLEVHGECCLQKGSYNYYHPAAEGSKDLYMEDPLAMSKKKESGRPLERRSWTTVMPGVSMILRFIQPILISCMLLDGAKMEAFLQRRVYGKPSMVDLAGVQSGTS